MGNKSENYGLSDKEMGTLGAKKESLPFGLGKKGDATYSLGDKDMGTFGRKQDDPAFGLGGGKRRAKKHHKKSKRNRR